MVSGVGEDDDWEEWGRSAAREGVWGWGPSVSDAAGQNLSENVSLRVG